MASFDPDIARAVALELTQKILTLYAAILPIEQEVAAWTLNNVDRDLPTPFAIRVQLESYKALAIETLRLKEWVNSLLAATVDDIYMSQRALASGKFDGSATFNGKVTFGGTGTPSST